MGVLFTWGIWSCLQCFKHNPQINTKKSLDTITIQSAMTISFQSRTVNATYGCRKANPPMKLIFMKAGNEKSLLKVTLAPGSAHTDIPIITTQKGLCVWKPENISSLHNSMFHSTEHYVGFFSFCKLSKCIHNSILSLWCRNTVKKMNTAI